MATLDPRTRKALVVIIAFLLAWSFCNLYPLPPQRDTLSQPGVTQITSAQDGLGLSDPAWSPDGKQIAVVDAQVLGPHTERHEIYLVDVVSGEFRRITDAESGEKNKAPSWSPEGKRLGLWSDEFGQSGVGYIGLESGEAVWVANSYELEWLPDNHRVAFLAGGEEGTQIDAGLGIAVRDLDTGETGVIWQDASAIQFDSVEWARNTDLVVISYESLDATGHWQPPLNRDIHVIDMNGVDQVVVATEEDETSPTWSPDAKMLAYAKGDNNNSTLWVSNADGSCAIQLLDVKRTTDPAWSPDGTRIAFMYSLDLYILDLTAEPVAERMKGLDCEDRSGFGRPDALILRKIRGVANPFASCTLT